MDFALLFMLIVSSILAAHPLPMNQHPEPSSQVHPPESYKRTVKVKFLDGASGEHEDFRLNGKSTFGKRVEGKVNNAITAALGMDVEHTLIDYFGIFKEHEPNYYIVIEGQKCPGLGCFGWMSEDIRTVGGGRAQESQRSTYYIGISSGAPVDQFQQDVDNCVGVNPPLITMVKENGQRIHKKPLERWEAQRTIARDAAKGAAAFSLTVVGTNKHTVKVNFFDGNTGGHTDEQSTFATATRTRVSAAITAALDLDANTEIDYRGEFKPLGEHKIIYCEVFGGQKCQGGCFAWMAEDDATDSKGRKNASARMYYTGISLGAPALDQFKDADNCVGVNPPLITKVKENGQPSRKKAFERWEKLRTKAEAEAPSFPSDILSNKATLDNWFNYHFGPSNR
ncbi:hypothetical protein BDP27DRAFT_1412982 [Rhodocollybia butyracea]|uniref:Uncharacterized protein n=1 Tax=Rhodocollybia butyracea TaxID=206335 RepID=A0A9P5QAC2_9AGAR|nr:hypothetical protein BDP27DRAFT_1412982 [Rhodocollybia butyracea]